MTSLSLIPFLLIYSDLSLKERASLLGEYDSNVYRTTSIDGRPIVSDFDLRLQSDFSLKYSKGRHLLRLNLTDGGKIFINESDANTLVNQGEFTYFYKKNFFSPEIGIEVKDIRTVNTIQDYTIIRPFGAINLFSNIVNLKLLIGIEDFSFYYNNNYSYKAGFSGLITSFPLDENLSLNINYAFKYLFFDGYAYERAGNIEKDTLITRITDNKRRDINHSFILRMNYESDIILSFSYNPEINSSNSAGESVFRQRFQLSVTSELFYRIYLNLLLSLMISSFKDGILISDILLITNDSENRNYLIIKLSREIYKNTMIEFRYAYYYSEFSNYITRFSRSVVSLGLSIRL